MKNYSVDDLENDSLEAVYLKLKSRRRNLKKINTKISRLNKYYNSTTELFARSFELYITDKKLLNKIAPKVADAYEQVLSKNCIPMLSNFVSKVNVFLN